MALSNIFREPRREIIESVVGMLVVLVLAVCDYLFAVWLQHHLEVVSPGGPGYWNGFWVIGMLIGVLAIALVYPLLFLFPHFIGEIVCNRLSGVGIELRPKRRY